VSDRSHQLLYRAAHAAARRAGAVPDADLVRQLAVRHDRAAFELLLWRHGPAVWGVCRRVLGPSPDADDAFQAVFVALHRRAGAIAEGNAVAGWLHRVAVRAAVAVAKTRARRWAREAPTPTPPEPFAPDDPVQTAAGRELGAVLDAAIARLPERYRLPFLLCEVYGRAPTDAAAELKCPVGTVASRLSRAKRRLRAMLARRGLALPAVLAVPALPAGLSAAVLRNALGAAAVPVRLAALADRAVRPPLVGMWKVAAAVVLVATSAGFLARAQPTTPPAGKSPPAAAAKKADVETAPINEAPLPDGAVARLGSTRLRHAGGVYDVAFSPDGKWVATAGGDGAVFVWDAATGERRFRFPAVVESRPQVAFVDGGRALWIFSPHSVARGVMGSDLRRFSLADGKELSEVLPEVERRNLFGLGFDPSGKRFGYVQYAGAVRNFRVLDTAAGKEISTSSVPAQWTMRPAFAPSGKLVAFPPGLPGAALPVIDVDTGTEVASITDPNYVLGATAFAPDGRTLATIGTKPKEGTDTVAVWDTTKGKLIRRLTGVELTASCLAYSPNGKYLAVGTLQRQAVQLFEVATGKEVRRFPSSPSVMHVAFSPDGRRLAAARTAGTVSIWDVETGKPTAASADPHRTVTELRFLDRDRLMANTVGVVLYNWRTGKVLERSTEAQLDTAFDHTFVSPDRRLIAVPEWRGAIRLHGAVTGAEVKRLEGHTVLAEPVVFSADGARLYSRGHDGTVRGWDVAAGKELWKADFAHPISGDRLAVSPDGTRVAASGQEREGSGSIVQVWDAETGKAGPRFHPPKGRIARLAFSPDSGVLAVAGGEMFDPSGPGPGWVVLWDLLIGTVRRTLADPTGVSVSLMFTPDGRSVVTGGMDGTLRVWELATGRERWALTGHGAAPYTLAVSADGRHFASSSADTPILVWDLYAGAGGPLTEVGGKQLVADLGGDATPAFTAVRRLASRPAEAVALLRAHFKPAGAIDPKRVGELIKGLDADRFAAREQATAELQKLGTEVEPAVRAALVANPSAEARERLTQLLPKVAEPSAERLRELRAVEILEAAGTPEAMALLEEWAKDKTLRASPDAAAAHGRLRRP
jgi:RNA polymerase sigma factor (sigma-70 family)